MPQKQALLVVGMHRSGTSALTRVLNLLGYDLGSDLLPAHHDNQEGFWEHRGVVLLHEEMLNAMGTTWFDPTRIPTDFWQRDGVAPYRDRLREILERDFASSELFAVKDPRLCRLLPLWTTVLSEMDCDIRVVLAGRDPREVSKSLAKRDGLPDGHAALLWVDHLLRSERDSRRFRRGFVTFDALLADWRAALSCLAGSLGLDWSGAIATAGDTIDEALKPKLRHHTELTSSFPDPWSESIWNAFREASEGRPEIVEAVFDRAADELERFGAPFYGWQATNARRLAELTTKYSRVNQLLEERTRRVKQLREQIESGAQTAPVHAPVPTTIAGAATTSEPEIQPEEPADDARDSNDLFGEGTEILRDYETPEGSPKVSIVIPLFNQAPLTIQCLESLAQHTSGDSFEVILVDNASKDETADVLSCLDGNVKIVRNVRNRGFAVACNQGAALATTDKILFLNNDIEARSGWLEPLLKTLDEDPTVGVVGSKLLFPDGTIQHAGVVLLSRPGTNVPLRAMHMHYKMAADDPVVNDPMCYQVVTGACLMVRREVFEAVGGFDTYFWNGCEDVDLCLKAGEAGWKVVYEPTSVLVHHESASGPERFSKTRTNEHLLCTRWVGRAAPDLVDPPGGARAVASGTPVRSYVRPGSVATTA